MTPGADVRSETVIMVGYVSCNSTSCRRLGPGKPSPVWHRLKSY